MSTAARSANPDKSNRLIFIGAVGLAVIAALLVFLSLSNFGGGDGGVGAIGATQNVVVASQDIAPGTKITSDMLKIATLPNNAVIDGAFKDTSGLAGLTARYPLAQGDQVSAIKLGQTTKNCKTLACSVVPNGKRAVAVQVDENTSVGGLIVAGDHVDVIALLKSPSSGSGEQLPPKAFTLLQDIEVLAVAQTAQKGVTRFDKDGNPIKTDTADGSISTGPDNTDAKPKAKTITLSVDPQDAPIVALAQDQGTVWLTLRAFGDTDKPDVNPRALPTP